jgi:hypothetical protein
MSDPIRKATSADVSAMVRLAELVGDAVSHYEPDFFRRAERGSELQTRYFERQVHDGQTVALGNEKAGSSPGSHCGSDAGASGLQSRRPDRAGA